MQKFLLYKCSKDRTFQTNNTGHHYISLVEKSQVSSVMVTKSFGRFPEALYVKVDFLEWRILPYKTEFPKCLTIITQFFLPRCTIYILLD